MKKFLIFAVLGATFWVSCKDSDKEKAETENEALFRQEQIRDSIDALNSADSALIEAVYADKTTVSVKDIAPASDTSFTTRSKKFYRNDANSTEKMAVVFGVKPNDQLGVALVQIEGQKEVYRLPQTENKGGMIGVYSDGKVTMKQNLKKVTLTIGGVTQTYTQIL